MQPLISMGGSRSSTTRSASAWNARPAGLSGVRERDGRTVVAALRHRRLERDARDEWRTDLGGECIAAAGAEHRLT